MILLMETLGYYRSWLTVLAHTLDNFNVQQCYGSSSVILPRMSAHLGDGGLPSVDEWEELKYSSRYWQM